MRSQDVDAVKQFLNTAMAQAERKLTAREGEAINAAVNIVEGLFSAVDRMADAAEAQVNALERRNELLEKLLNSPAALSRPYGL